jgi:hypothetical protein
MAPPPAQTPVSWRRRTGPADDPITLEGRAECHDVGRDADQRVKECRELGDLDRLRVGGKFHVLAFALW